MADPPPLVVSYLKLPPDEELFFAIRDLFQTIMEKLNHLALVVAAIQDIHSSPEIKSAIQDLQDAAGEHCLKAALVTELCNLYAKTIIGLVNFLLTSPSDNRSFEDLDDIPLQCTMIAEECDKATMGMESLCHEVPSTVHHITAALNEGDKRADVVFTKENSQTVNDLIHVAKGSHPTFHKVKEHFLEARTHFQDPELLRVGSPSRDELDIMLQRWSGLSAALEEVNKSFSPIHSDIWMGPDIIKVSRLKDNRNTRDENVAKGPGTSTIPITRKAITNSDSPAAAPSEAAPSSGPKARWWQLWWRRIASCLTLKHFR